MSGGDPVDQHADEACAMVSGELHFEPWAGSVQFGPDPSETQLIAQAAAATAGHPIEGDQLIENLVEILAPTYGQDNAELAKDDVLRRFIRDDARLVAIRMADLGLALHRRAEK